jgi:hypothetical protein
MHRVSEGDVCISWSNLVVGLGKRWKSLNCYGFTFLWLPHYGEWFTVHKSLVTERTPCLQGCICVQHYVIVLYAILC